jgi:hypothetical protein
MKPHAAVHVFVRLSALAGEQDSRPPQNPPPSSNQSRSVLSQNQAVMTNQQDVADMARAGISPDIVAVKVNNSKCQCDPLPRALGTFKAEGVPDVGTTRRF